MLVCLRCLLQHILSLIAYTFRENRDFVFIITVQFMMSANSWICFGLLHDVQFLCAINQPLLAHHWRVPSIPRGVSAPGGKMLKQLLKDHNFLNNSPIFIIESSILIYLLFKKHCIQCISIWKVVLNLVTGTWHHNFMAGCGSLLWANTCSLWSGIKSWPGAWCLQRLVRRSCQ